MYWPEPLVVTRPNHPAPHPGVEEQDLSPGGDWAPGDIPDDTMHIY